MEVTGSSNSRLSELRKYVVTPIFVNQYIGGGNYNTDGVDYINTIDPSKSIIYYLGGIKYIDVFGTKTIYALDYNDTDTFINEINEKFIIVYGTDTTFTFTALGTSSPDFINVPYYKDPNKENIVSYPKINDDVFIIRQELSAFDKNYRLEFIKNLVDLETYASGKFFNIVNNT